MPYLVVFCLLERRAERVISLVTPPPLILLLPPLFPHPNLTLESTSDSYRLRLSIMRILSPISAVRECVDWRDSSFTTLNQPNSCLYLSLLISAITRFVLTFRFEITTLRLLFVKDDAKLSQRGGNFRQILFDL